VAQVVTRFIAGAGGVALRGAIGLDPAALRVDDRDRSGGSLIDQAAAAGLEVLTLRHMRPAIAPADDIAGVRELRALFELGRFDVVHTHSSKPVSWVASPPTKPTFRPWCTRFTGSRFTTFNLPSAGRLHCR